MTAVAPVQYMELTPGQAVPDDAPRSPALELFRQYGDTMMTIPGLNSIRIPMADDAKLLKLGFRDQETRAVGSAVITDSLGGVQLLKTTFDTSDPVDRPDARRLVETVAGMRGVWDYQLSIPGPGYPGYARFKTVDEASTSQLDPLVRDVLSGYSSYDGSQLDIKVSWASHATDS